MSDKHNSNFSNYRLYTSDILENNGELYMPIGMWNGVAKVNIFSKEVEVICKFDDANIRELFKWIVKIDDKILFMPNYAKSMAIYSLKSKTIEYINHGLSSGIEGEKNVSLSQVVQYYVDKKRNITYLMGYSYPGIVMMDMVSKKCTYINDWIKLLDDKHLSGNGNRIYVGHGYLERGNDVFFPLQSYGGLLKLNTETQEVSLISLDTSLRGIGSISENGGYICLVGAGKSYGDLAVLTSNFELIEEFTLFKQENKDDYMMPFFQPVVIDDIFYLFPIDVDSIYELDTNKMQLAPSKFYNKLFSGSEYIDSVPPIHMVKKIGCKLYLIMRNDFKWFIYDIKTRCIEDFYLNLPTYFVQDNMISRVKNIIESDTIISEEEYSLDCFIQSITATNVF